MRPINFCLDIFIPRFQDFLDKRQLFQIFFGGRGSGKSHNIFMMVVIWMMRGKSILGIMANDAHIRRSIFSKVVKSIRAMNLEKYFKISLWDASVECLISKGCFVTSGLKDMDKIKGIEAKNDDQFHYIIFEECTAITEDQFEFARGSVRGKEKPISILLFNPISKSHWLYDRFFLPLEESHNFNLGRSVMDYEDEELLIHKSTYIDNPYTKLNYVRQFELLKERNPRLYQVDALGNFGVAGKLIYENWNVVDKLPEDLKGYEIRAGIDNGINDAQTFSLSYVNKKDLRIYIIDEISVRGLTSFTAFSDMVKEKLFQNGLSPRTRITVDNSPKIYCIKFKEANLNVKKAKKPAGSVLDRTVYLSGFEINILSKCKETINSISIYSNKKNKDGSYSDIPHHDGSDMMDGFGYGYEDDYLGRTKISLHDTNLF